MADERRVALVIGNAAYQHIAPLDNPGNDAKLIADALRDAGFTLVGGEPQLNLTKQAFDNAVRQFGAAIEGADVALFYYAGHGSQVDGLNWLAPVDAEPSRPQDLEYVMVEVGAVLRQMEGSGARLNLVLLDACRDNPFLAASGRGGGRGLAPMRAPGATLISYSTQPGAVAMDGAGADSPYSLALAEALRTPGLELFQTFNAVGVAVKRATGAQQVPWVASSPIEGSFQFRPGAAPAAAPPPRRAPMPGRLSLALVAAEKPKTAATQLPDFHDAKRRYAIERDLTLPGDITVFEPTITPNGQPALRFELAPAAVARINAGGDLTDRRLALVLDGRTVLAEAVLRTGLTERIEMTGNFTVAETERLAAALTPSQ
jgi:uncharacterized caspase-like protein